MMDVEGGKEALERELNQTRDRLRAAQAASGDWLAEQNTQLRTITQLQAVQAELQRELKIKDQQLERARIGPGSAAATTVEDESISASIRIEDESQLDDAIRAVFAEVVSDGVSRT